MVLINLLIAMFASAYDRVANASEEHWRYQWMQLYIEYSRRPLFPPPLNLLELVYRYVE